MDAPYSYHAAEYYFQRAGYRHAMADGKMSLSGPKGGYGWLIIIDHPQANIYSLYGHLSSEPLVHGKDCLVAKGILIAYLGILYENGGSHKEPLEPHLHLGILSRATGVIILANGECADGPWTAYMPCGILLMCLLEVIAGHNIPDWGLFDARY